jgi:hypothetical protein
MNEEECMSGVARALDRSTLEKPGSENGGLRSGRTRRHGGRRHGNGTREADVAVKDGKIAAVGAVRGKGSGGDRAKGLLVTPGFVDIHTHYDGQATWDSHLQPSSWHGVTTAVMGNCGVGFAPVKIEDRQRLIELMEGVEDIPWRGARRRPELVVGIVRPVSRRARSRGRATSISAPSCRTARCACS